MTIPATPTRAPRPRTTHFTAFVDLLGARYLAQYKSTEYREALHEFHKAVADLAHELDPRSFKIFFFSDCMYIHATELKSLLSFLDKLRFNLAIGGRYFKGAVAAVPLEPSPASNLPNVRDEDLKRKRESILNGYYFGEKVAELFGKQEELKGIGLWLLGGAASRAGVETVRSCFLAADGRRIQEYVDLRLGRRWHHGPQAEGILDKFWTQFSLAKARSRKFGRNYVSFLVTWIRSVDEEGIEAARASGQKSMVDVLLGGEFDRWFGDVPGVECVYFALLDAAWHHKDRDKALYRRVRRYLRQRPRLMRLMERMPLSLLSGDVRDDCVESLSMDLFSGKASDRDSLAALRQILPECRTYSDVVKILREQKVQPLEGSDGWRVPGLRKLATTRGFDDLLGSALREQTADTAASEKKR